MIDIKTPKDGRLWWPEFQADESMPAGKPTPAAWLFRLDDGAQRYGSHGADERWGSRPVSEGEVCDFLYSDALGTVTLTVNADGTHKWSHDLPEEANYFWNYDTETLADSPDEFVKRLRETIDEDCTEPSIILGVRLGHDGEVRLTFTALDGPPRFVVVAAEAST